MIDIKERISFFREQLDDSNKTNLDIVREFLCFGHPYIFKGDESKYFKLKSEISKKFNVHPNEVLMIGSGKLGFSIAPDKLWKPFDIDSDIDIAIVSEAAFNYYWNELKKTDIDLFRRDVKTDSKYQEFLLYLFKGWLRPDKFNIKNKLTREWFEYFNSLKSIISEDKEYKISAGIYKDFESFEYHFCKNITIIKNIIKGEKE